jgi:hypothetical protein
VEVQGYVCNWNGHESRAVELERDVGRLIPTTVINTERPLTRPRDHWVHLDPSAYFTEQWNRALELFDADVLFQVQADAHFDDFEALLDRATAAFRRGDVGVYEPDLDYTGLRFDTSRLRAVAGRLYEVPMTDQTCWFVSAEALHRLPPVDPTVNRYGWGVSVAMAAVCHLTGKLSVRDYAFAIEHPRRRGYSSEEAARQRDAYLEGLPSEISREAARLYEWRTRVAPGR